MENHETLRHAFAQSKQLCFQTGVNNKMHIESYKYLDTNLCFFPHNLIKV